MGVSGPDGHHLAPAVASHPDPAAAVILADMTTIRLAWGTAARSGISGTVTFTPTRRYWREDTRVADEAAPVTVTVPEQPGTATVDLDPTGESWCYAVTWTPDGPLATEWTEYVTVPAPPAGDPLGAIPYRDLLKLTRDAAAVLTGETALTAAAALARADVAADRAQAAADDATAAVSLTAGLPDRVTELETVLPARVSELGVALTAALTRVSGLETALDGSAARVAELEAALDRSGARVSGLEAALAAAVARLDALTAGGTPPGDTETPDPGPPPFTVSVAGPDVLVLSGDGVTALDADTILLTTTGATATGDALTLEV